jgi:predicted deacylase
MDIREFDARSVQRNTKQALYLDVTSTPGGMPIRQTVLTVGGAEPGPLMVVSGGVHGDEWEGPLAIIRLFKELTPRNLRGTFVGLVVANVPAFDAAMHSSPIDGLSLNSAFPGDPNGSITNQIAYWMGQRLIGPSDFYIDLHSSSSDIDFPTLCVYKPGTGKAAELSRQAAEAFHAPVVWAFPDYGPRRPFSYAHEHDIPALSTECPASRRVVMDDVALYQRGVRNAMRIMGMLEGDLEGSPARHYLYGNPETTMVTARTSGFLVLQRELLDWVEEDQLLATILDLTGEVVEEVRATTRGYVLLRQLVPTVQAGDLLFYLVGKYPPEI